jgi:hypothetical protein
MSLLRGFACIEWTVMKVGQTFDVQKFDGMNDEVTVMAPDKSALSFVNFYCTVQEVQEDADDVPSNNGKTDENPDSGNDGNPSCGRW